MTARIITSLRNASRCSKLYCLEPKFQRHFLPNIEVKQFHQSSSCYEILDIQTESDFKSKVMKSKIPVIVNFHADWCQPCHSFRPLLEGIVKANPGKLSLAEVNKWKNKSSDYYFLLTIYFCR